MWDRPQIRYMGSFLLKRFSNLEESGKKLNENGERIITCCHARRSEVNLLVLC